MSGGDYLVGLVFFLGIWGGTGLAALLIARRRLAHLRGAPLVLAVAVLWTVALLIATLLPGALTLLSRGTVLAAALLLLLATMLWLAPARSGVTEAREAPPADVSQSPRESRASRTIAILGVGIFAAWALATTVQLAGAPAGNVDALSFHLPGIARWIQSGSIWQINQFIPQVATGHYPSNGNAIELAAILPWRNDFLFRELNLPFVVMTALAVFAIAEELGASRTLAALIAAAAAAMPAVVRPALESPLPDIILLATFATGLLFLVRHFRTGLTSDLVLAGLGLGVAFGTKWYGVTSVPFLIGVWAACFLGAKRPVRVVVRQVALVGSIVLAVGGIWLVRNWVESGDPFFPARIAVGGTTIFAAPPDPRGALVNKTIADYATNLSVIRHGVLPAFWTWYALGGFLIFTAYLGAGGALAARWRREARERRWALLALMTSAALLAVIYFKTPASATGTTGEAAGIGFNTRYGVPALLLAAAAAGWLGGLVGRWRVAAEALALAAIIDELAVGFVPSANSVLAVLMGLAALVFARRLLGPAWARFAAPTRRATALAAATVVALGGVAVGYATQRKFNDQGYGGYATVDWVLEHAPQGHRIGVAGTWDAATRSPIRALFGPRLRNDVHTLGSYDRGWLTPYDTQRAFQAGLRQGRFDLLLVGTDAEFGPPFSEASGWAERAGLVLVARDPQLALYRNSTPR